MQAKWRPLILLAYTVFLMWQFAGVISSAMDLEGLFSMVIRLAFTLAPVAVLCLIPQHDPAMGIAALVVAAFGVWAYHVNDGDPIGLAIIIFYQFCIMGVAMLVIYVGSAFLGKKP